MPILTFTDLRPWPRDFERRTAGPAGWARLLASVARLVAAVTREYDARCDARELKERDDFVLRDLGICRGEIERVVRFGQDRL
jgi:uncharacterized protein YjiS (DUF1127 family)